MKRLLWLALPLCLAACEEPAPANKTASPPSTTQAAALADTDLAVPADFEEKVAAEIKAENYKAELDKLETEIVD